MNHGVKQRLFRHDLYKFTTTQALSATQLEAACYLEAWPRENGGLGRYGHLRNYIALTWPGVEWNPWLERQMNGYATAVKPSRTATVGSIAMTGGAAAGKSFSAALFGSAWWRFAPHESTVLLCSTTKEMLRRRIWSHIPALFYDAVNEPMGHLIESRTKILAEPGDEIHAIIGIAVAEGDTQKAIQNIKGIHAKRILVIIDEGEATPEAIFATIPNLRKGCKELLVVTLGNSVSMTDPHGRVCHPKNGWNSVGIETEEWDTAGVLEWQIPPGKCLHFDGFKSPNVKLGWTKYPYLYSFEDFQAANERPDYANTVGYWSHDRGFWPPNGVSDQLFTETLIKKYEATAGCQFTSYRIPVAFLDPAFGGDDCKLILGSVGDVDGKMTLRIDRPMTIPITSASKDEIDYEVARAAIAHCKSAGVHPEHFGVDAVGTGRGVAAIIAGEWSPKIIRHETTQAPTDRPSSTADGRPSKEVYDRYATETWFLAREVVQGNQVRGLYPEAVRQLCERRYEMKARKYSIETKAKFKARIGRSPDDADAVIGLIEVARKAGLRADTVAARMGQRGRETFQKTASEIYNDGTIPQEFAECVL